MKKKVALVGSPNVGKSVIFNYLTGSYVNVSNYPGTTVDVSRGDSVFNGKKFEIIDTPGIYSLMPLTDEERVTRQLIFQETPDIVIHVVDAKNLKRMLGLTLQLMDAGLSVILNINMIDEARDLGIRIDANRLAELLGIPVNISSAVKKLGMESLKHKISAYDSRPVVFRYSENIENAITHISAKIKQDYGMSVRMAALLLLQGDELMCNAARSEPDFANIMADIWSLAKQYEQGLDYIITLERQAIIDKLLLCSVMNSHVRQGGLSEHLGRIAREPLTGIPVLLFVLYFGIYKFVGQFGAGFLVDFIDEKVFNGVISPIIKQLITQYMPYEYEWLTSLLIGEYGIISLGFRYAIVIILPIVGTFFLVFSLLEDCGYLPRLALLVDRIFKYFGLNGRAVIPITLGLGCGTMAVMVTRTLESRRERIIATFLLSLTIPCSAQLGLVLAILSHNPVAVAIWAGYVLAVFIIAGWLFARIMPGERSAFYMELPPLRMPLLTNVVTKAYTRMSWYFIEILPVFIITSLVLWVGERSGILSQIIYSTEPVMTLLGLPRETAQSFLLGFFRRDYGTAGLYDLCLTGVLTDRQLLVAAITLTLFVPCIAQLVVMIKERGIIASAFMVALIIMIALLAGWTANYLSGIVPFI